MSVIVMGAVLQHGPKRGPLRHALVAIADNADDYGFAFVSMETIALKSCCDKRTAMRRVAALELEGWMRVERDVGAIDGRCNVYFLDVARLGIDVHPKMRRSEMHDRVLGWLRERGKDQKTGDKMSPVARGVSRDNQVPTQVTKTADSGDKTVLPILKNRCKPLLNQTTPTPPQAEGGEALREVAGEQVRMDPGAVMGPEFLEAVMAEREASNGNGAARENESGEEAALAAPAGIAPKRARQLQVGAIQVLRAIGVVANPRLELTIGHALELYASQQRVTPQRAASRMMENSLAYNRDRERLRYDWGWKEFFGGGHWARPATWPYDRTRMGRQAAAVGTATPEEKRLREPDVDELDEVNAMRARRTPPLGPLTWEDYAKHAQ